MTSAPIAIVAAVIRDAAGRVLLVRKRGTTAFMQPGGKYEAGEGALDALARELREELGCRLVRSSAVALGEFGAPAANEPERDVHAAVFAVDVEGAIAAQAEIAELVWLPPDAPSPVELAPLTRDHILPLLAAAQPRRSAHG